MTMKSELYDYDIYPKVVISNETNTVSIQPLGDHREFKKDHEYTIKIYKVDESNPSVYPERSGRYTLTAKPDNDGILRFEIALEGEGEYFINLHEDPDSRRFLTLSMYSLEADMLMSYGFHEIL